MTGVETLDKGKGRWWIPQDQRGRWIISLRLAGTALSHSSSDLQKQADSCRAIPHGQNLGMPHTKGTEPDLACLPILVPKAVGLLSSQGKRKCFGPQPLTISQGPKLSPSQHSSWKDGCKSHWAHSACWNKAPLLPSGKLCAGLSPTVQRKAVLNQKGWFRFSFLQRQW